MSASVPTVCSVSSTILSDSDEGELNRAFAGGDEGYVTEIDGMMRVVLFPDDDGVFVAQVRNAVADFERNVTDGHDTRSGVVEMLRALLPEYPKLEIRQQDGLASFEKDPRTWYIYRDGSARPR
jgi:hypothetical protein